MRCPFRSIKDSFFLYVDGTECRKWVAAECMVGLMVNTNSPFEIIVL